MKIRKYHLLICCFLLLSCFNDTDDVLTGTLSSYTKGVNIELGAVIACASSDEITNEILTFYYPEAGAKNVRFYETSSIEVNPNEFLNYKQIFLESEPFFNGYLGKFTQASATEKWIIITFELNDEIKISNPIRTKQITKPTIWTNDVLISTLDPLMPNFSWEDNPFGDNAIYFQIISDIQNNLLSGTYTLENNFQYYNTNNVVLNITTQNPPALITKTKYNFTLMDVSEDNWVNWVVQKSFDTK